MFTETHMEEAAECPGLGPAYFCSRDVVERAMASVQSSDFKPLLDNIVKQIQDHVWSGMQEHLLSDTEMNLQGAMWRQVDDVVKHILAGEDWAMKKYVLGERYDCERIRASVAAHIPEALRDARIADLEAKVSQLSKDLEFYRRNQ